MKTFSDEELALLPEELGAEYYDDDDEDFEYDDDDDDEDVEYDDDDDDEDSEDGEDAELLGLLDPIGSIAKGIFGGGRSRRRSRARPARPRNYNRYVRGRSGATMRTPYGAMRLQFTKKFVSKADLARALRRVRSDMKKNARAIKKVDARTGREVRALAASQKRSTKKLQKKIDEAKDSALLPLLLSNNRPEKLTLTGPGADAVTYSVDYPDGSGSNNNLLPLLLLGDSDLDPIMLLALTGGL